MDLQKSKIKSENATAQPPHVEPRWPVALAVVVLLVVLALLPSRAEILPLWISSIIMIALVVSISCGRFYGQYRWIRLFEQITTLAFAVLAEAVTLTGLAVVIHKMFHEGARINGQQLLTTSVAAWVTNVIAFSILYWRIDHGGPECRAIEDADTVCDWQFPQTQNGDQVPANWRPNYFDYLFLSFCTATAFSPTDVLPLTTRAKMLMMIESTVSLATLVIVASRAINILGN